MPRIENKVPTAEVPTSPTASSAIGLLKGAYTRFSAQDVGNRAASLSFFAVLAVAPLLVIALTGAEWVLGGAEARRQLLTEVTNAAGAGAAKLVGSIIDNARHGNVGLISSLISAIVILYGASNIFLQFDNIVGKLWDADAPPAGWVGMLKTRLVAFLSVLAFGALTLAWLCVDSWMSLASSRGGTTPLAFVLSFVTSIAFLTGAFSLAIKYVPRKAVPWSSVWEGALFSGLGVALGKQLMGLYLAHAGLTSAYGAAGSLVAVLLWIYYNAQIFFFGVAIAATKAADSFETRLNETARRAS